MKLTSRSEYALLALVHLARQDPSEFITVQAIAEAQEIPPRFLEQILLALKRARYVRSLKGQHGGYQLARPPKLVSLAEVIRLIDGALAPTESVSQYFYESTPIEKEKNLLGVFRKIRDLVSNVLEKTTLADVC
jgi:Rrf2 family protein